jgi:hypothetical protein
MATEADSTIECQFRRVRGRLNELAHGRQMGVRSQTEQDQYMNLCTREHERLDQSAGVVSS